MSSLKVGCIAGTLMFMHLIPTIFGWGEAGHFATCKIAQGFLSEAAKDGVKELLPKTANGELTAVCSWPDLPEIRRGYPWSRDLHFADTPDFMCSYDYLRDCHNPANEKNRCVIGAISNYTLQLESKYHHYGSEIKHNLTEALMFLSHFVGDLHQPLHLGFTGDLGGNRVMVRWFNETANLHHVWDDAIINTALTRYYGSNLTNFIEAIKSNITDGWLSEINSLVACHHSVCSNQYATESISLACQYAYKNATNGTQLADDYFLSRLPIVEKRLAQGGMRLAALLDKIFGTTVGIQKQVVSTM